MRPQSHNWVTDSDMVCVIGKDHCFRVKIQGDQVTIKT